MKSNSDAFDAPADSNLCEEDSTQWSLFERVQRGGTQQAREARAQIALIYSNILFEMTRRLKWKLDDATARDCVQGFLEKRILSGTLLDQADPQKGRFRTFLFVSFRNFVTDQMRSVLRNPVAFGQPLLPDGSPPGTELTEEDSQHLEVAWAREVLQQSIIRMREECQLSEQMRIWNVFEGRLLRPVTHMARPVSYDTLMDQCGFESVKEAANSLTTAKRIFRRVSRQVLEDFSGSVDSDEELRLLRSIFASGISLYELTAEDEQPDTASQRSWLLARALELPPREPFWTPEELQGAADEFLSLRLSRLLTVSIPSRETGAFADPTIREFLLTEPRSLTILSQLKDWTKQEFTSSETGFPPAVISAVYFSAICAARTGHVKRLTRLSDEALKISIGSLLESSWVPAACRHVLEESDASLGEGN